MAEVAYPVSSEVNEDRLVPTQDREVLLKILNRDEMCEVFYHRLLGEIGILKMDEQGNRVIIWKKTSKALMNKTGADHFMTFILSASSVDKTTTRIQPHELNTRCRRTYKTLAATIGKRYKEFGIDNGHENWAYVLGQLDDFYFFNLSGSRKGTLIDFMKPTMRHVETIGTRPLKKREEEKLSLR